MNRFIEIPMQKTANGGGVFETTATFKLDNLPVIFENITIKIDTGCSVSTIPLAKFKAYRPICEKLKSDDLKNNVSYIISYGVETGSTRPAIPQTFTELMNCPALKFKHNLSIFEICGVKINFPHIHLNYNRTGNILIGMDILKEFDIHIGKDKDGKSIFIACPFDSINEDYLSRLNELRCKGTII